MYFGVARAELHIPGAQSLKEKRRHVKSLVDRLHSKNKISVAEVDNHDIWQRATIGISAVAPDLSTVRRILSSCQRLLEGYGDVEVVDFWVVEERFTRD